VFRSTLARLFVHTTVMASLLTGFVFSQPSAHAAGKSPTPAKRNVPPPSVAPGDFASIVQRYGPAVVSISAGTPDQPATSANTEAVAPNDPFLAFFDRYAAQSETSGLARSPSAITGSGSGFIVSADGTILTAAHVVGHADEVTVRLTDRREFKGKVVAVDAQSGIAIVHIDANKLPTVKLGDSSRVREGEPVLTIGALDSFDNTVTAGVVSATSDTLPDGTHFPFFQTDVSGNPDNSGGPLVNRAGEVIGIDVQLYADTDRYSFVTFGIPINLASKVRSQLKAASAQPAADPSASGQPAADNLGLVVEDVSPGMAVALGLKKPRGALVDAVEPSASATGSNLKPGDVIVQIGNKQIGHSNELFDDAAALPPGTKAALRLIRNRKPMMTTMTIGDSAQASNNSDNTGGAGGPGNDASADNAVTSSASVTPIPTAAVTTVKPLNASTSTDRLGLVLHSLSDDERRSTGLAQGLMVDNVYEPGASAGIRPGDVVLSVGENLVETREQLNALVANTKGHVDVLIQRRNARSFVSVKLK
jgi:S1-C subfamily serine protease